MGNFKVKNTNAFESGLNNDILKYITMDSFKLCQTSSDLADLGS